MGLGVTAGLVTWLLRDLHAKAYARFERQAEVIDESIRTRLKLPFLVLKGAAGVYAASESVEQQEFRAYIESSQVALEFPSLRSIAFAERVNRSDLTDYVDRQRKEISADFSVKSSGDFPTLFVIKFVEPLQPNLKVVGHDLGFEPVRRSAIEKAIDTGEATLSGRIQLAGDIVKKPAILFVFPVYVNGAKPINAAERRAALSGVLVTSVVVDEIMADTVLSAQGQASFALHDAAASPPLSGGNKNASDAAGLLFDSSAYTRATMPAASRGQRVRPLYEMSRVIHMGGRSLVLNIAATDKFGTSAASLSPFVVGLGGSLLSGVLALLVWLLASGRASALRLAERMTLDLATERQRLVDIVEGTNVGCWVWHVQTGALQLDDRWAALLGFDLQALQPLNIDSWRARIHPDDKLPTRAVLARHFSGESRHFEAEIRMRHRDGHWVCLLGRGKVSVWSKEGLPQLMSGTHMDISDRYAAQLALRASEENFRHLFESSLHGILKAMPDGSVQYANPAACRLFGMTQDEIRARGREGLVDLQDSRWHIFLAQALMSGEARAEITMIRKDGVRLECEISLTSYLNPAGACCNNIFLRDVTKRKQAEAQISALNLALEDKVKHRTAQLQAANKELEAFSYSVAHDLRAPLSSIDGFSHLLEKSIADQAAERSGHYLRRIRSGIRQMGELTDGLLLLAQISRTSLKTDTVNLTAMAWRVLHACQERNAAQTVKLNVQEGLGAIGDSALLRQVMENLLGNAWKFTARAEFPEIWVGQLPAADELAPVTSTYFVRDNGAGFDMAYVDKLFGTFQRLHSPGEFAGTGIGLATTHRIVQRHGGRIWAEGAVGQGATFYFTLPSAGQPRPG